MSKTKQQNRSETEHLRGLVKKLKSENRQLKKRVRALDKKAHFYEEVVDEVAKEVSMSNACPECPTGNLKEHDFVHIILTKCNHCEYEKKRKPRNGKAKTK